MNNKRKVFVLLIVIMLILIGPRLIKQVKSVLTTVEKEFYLLQEIETGHEDDLIYKKLDSGLVQYWDGILYLYDMTGKQKWHTYIGIVNPIIKTNSNSVYMLDNDKNQLIRIGKNGEILYRYTIEGALVNFEVCEENYVILQYFSQKNITNLKILNKEGREHNNILLTEGEVINISISKTHNYIGINTLVTNNVLESRLLTYDIDGQLIGSNNLEEQFVLGFLYDSKGNMIVVKEEEVFSINKSNRVKWSVFLNKIKLFKGFLTEHMVLYSDESGKNPLIHTKEGEEIKVLQYNGKVIGEFQIDGKVNGLDIHEEAIVFYSPRTIYFLDKRGNLEVEYKYSSDIEEIFVFSKGHLVIVTKGKLSFMKMSEG